MVPRVENVEGIVLGVTESFSAGAKLDKCNSTAEGIRVYDCDEVDGDRV